jgi:hypothetical protein
MVVEGDMELGERRERSASGYGRQLEARNGVGLSRKAN